MKTLMLLWLIIVFCPLSLSADVKEVVSAYVYGEECAFSFSFKISEFRIVGVKPIDARNLGRGLSFIIIAKSDVDSKWYFRTQGFMGNTRRELELGVQPPADYKVMGIRYLGGDSFSAKFTGLKEPWYYYTSCFGEGDKHAKDIVGFYLQSQGQVQYESTQVENATVFELSRVPTGRLNK